MAKERIDEGMVRGVEYAIRTYRLKRPDDDALIEMIAKAYKSGLIYGRRRAVGRL